MTPAEAKKAFDMGSLSRAEMSPIFTGWVLVLTDSVGTQHTIEATDRDNTARRQTRIFKSTDTAIKTARQIGFNMVVVEGLQK